MESKKLPNTEFKIMVIRLLNEPSENFHSMKKDIEQFIKNHS